MTGKPSIMDLWRQAGGGTDHWDSQRYRDLMHEHGYLLRPGDDGYEDATHTLPCGWPGNNEAR